MPKKKSCKRKKRDYFEEMSLSENVVVSQNNKAAKEVPLEDGLAVVLLKCALRSVYFGLCSVNKRVQKVFGWAATRMGKAWPAGMQKIAARKNQLSSAVSVRGDGQGKKALEPFSFKAWATTGTATKTKCAIVRFWRLNKAHNLAFVPALVSICAISLSFYLFANYSIGINVYLDEERIASVSEQKEFEDMLSNVEGNVASQIGEPFRSNLVFTYEFGLHQKGEVETTIDLYNELLPHFDTVKQLAILEVDDKIIGANENGEGLEALLDKIKAPYEQDEGVSYVEFDKKVEISTRLSTLDAYKSLGEIEKILTEPKQQEVTYTIQGGDTFSAIAPRYGMSASALIALNNDKDPTKMHPGDTVLVSKEVPLLSVRSVKQVEYTEAIAFQTENVNDDSMYKNQKKVEVQGVEGVQKIEAEIIMVDGMEVERRILSTQVLTEPVTKVVLVGTKTPPPSAPTGAYMRPTSGTVTSPFGYRGREFHTGIDIANRTGTAIYAADGGTVIFSGWKGSYGYTIIIDHGNGIQTLYAHCSKLHVQSGAQVPKGTLIASMGSTGRSTGPHLHFEVRVNGKQVNPRNYVAI